MWSELLEARSYQRHLPKHVGDVCQRNEPTDALCPTWHRIEVRATAAAAPIQPAVKLFNTASHYSLFILFGSGWIMSPAIYCDKW